MGCVDPARKIRIGNKLYFGENDELVAEVIDNTTSRGRTLRFLFNGTHEEFMQTVHQLGQTPLPRYMTRDAEPEDRDRFQTIYASEEGAVAVPTAGLHFSKNLLKRLEIKGIDMAFLTLHIGLGTFREVEVEDLSKHKVDSEELTINEVHPHRQPRHREQKAHCRRGHHVPPWPRNVGEHDADPEAVQGLDQQVHLPQVRLPNRRRPHHQLPPPQSTLLMTTAAFAGHELTMEAYQEAIKEKYRFFAYGDALMVI